MGKVLQPFHSEYNIPGSLSGRKGQTHHGDHGHPPSRSHYSSCQQQQIMLSPNI